MVLTLGSVCVRAGVCAGVCAGDSSRVQCRSVCGHQKFFYVNVSVTNVAFIGFEMTEMSVYDKSELLCLKTKTEKSSTGNIRL